MPMLQEWLVRIKLDQDALIIETDPSLVAGRIKDRHRRNLWKRINRNRFIPKMAKSGVNRFVRETRRFDIHDDGKFDFVPFEIGNTHIKLKDVWDHRDAPERSATYKDIFDKLTKTGTYKYKNLRISEKSEIIPLIEACFLDLLISMEKEGYLPDKKSAFATGGTGLAIVWSDGKLWHEDGATHRLAAARIVGLRHGFPLRIVGAHRDWLAAQGIRGLPDISRLPLALRSLDAASETVEGHLDRELGASGDLAETRPDAIPVASKRSSARR